MLAMIFTVIFGIGIAYFATQNTVGFTLHFASYTFNGIPVYLVVLVSLLIGLLFGWIFQLLNSISSLFMIKGKEHALLNEKRANLELTKKIHQLELENTRLMTKENEIENNSL